MSVPDTIRVSEKTVVFGCKACGTASVINGNAPVKCEACGYKKLKELE